MGVVASRPNPLFPQNLFACIVQVSLFFSERERGRREEEGRERESNILRLFEVMLCTLGNLLLSALLEGIFSGCFR